MEQMCTILQRNVLALANQHGEMKNSECVLVMSNRTYYICLKTSWEESPFTHATCKTSRLTCAAKNITLFQVPEH